MPDKKLVYISVLLNETLTFKFPTDRETDSYFTDVSHRKDFELWSSDQDIFNLLENKILVITHIKGILSSIAATLPSYNGRVFEHFDLPKGFKSDYWLSASRRQCEIKATIQVADYLSQMIETAIIKPDINHIDDDYGKVFNIDSLFVTFTAQDAATKFLAEANNAIKEYDKEFVTWKKEKSLNAFSQLDNNQQYYILFSFLCSFIQPWIDRLKGINAIQSNPMFFRGNSSNDSVRELHNISNPFYSHLLDSIRFVYDLGKNCHFNDSRLKRAYQDANKLSLDDFSRLEKNILRDRAIITYENQIRPLITDNILFCACTYCFKICFDVHSLIEYLGNENCWTVDLCKRILDSYNDHSSFINSDETTLAFVDQIKTIVKDNNHYYAVATCRTLINKLLDWAEGPTTGIDTLIDFYGDLEYYGEVASYTIENHTALHSLKICHVLSALSPIMGLMNEKFHSIIVKAQKAYSSFDVKSSFSVCMDFLTMCKSMGYKCDVDELTSSVLKNKTWESKPWIGTHHQQKRESILSKLKRMND